MRVTVDQVLGWGPCAHYNIERLEQLAQGRKYISHRTLAKLDIQPADRLWALLHLLTEREQHEIACDFAETVLSLVEHGEERPRVAIETKRRWLRAEVTDEELDAAKTAAWAAVWDADRDASRAASRAAAGATAWDAAWDAARDAAWAAALDAARDAAMAAARTAAKDAAYRRFIGMVVVKIDTREGAP